MNLLICDDETERAEEWKEELDFGGVKVAVEVPNKKELQSAINMLEVRRKQLRDGEGSLSGKCIFDRADILILDYDLLNLEEGAGFLTGDKVAYLARVFSTAGTIVVLNQYGLNEFDLSFAVDKASKADLNIGDIQLTNPGLWSFPVNGGYRPWSWPLLSQITENLELRMADLQGDGLDQPVLQFFGIDDDRGRFLSESALDSFSLRGGTSSTPSRNLSELSFRDFVLDCSKILEVKDADAIRKIDFDTQLCRIAASEVHKWLERRVLFEQDLLIDVPHLLERMPQIYEGGELSVETMTSAVSFEEEPMLNKAVSKYRFKKQHWLSRSAYWWPEIEIDHDVVKAVQEDDREIGDFVFREDVSSFGLPEHSRDFGTSAFGMYNRRYVSDGRKANGIEDSSPLDARDVVYSPSFRFAS